MLKYQAIGAALREGAPVARDSGHKRQVRPAMTAAHRE